MDYEYDTWEKAQQALLDAESDCRADFGDEGVEAGYADLVDSVSHWCSPEVRRELYRTTGCIDRETGYDPMAGV